MKRPYILLRILCGIVDFMVIMLPVQFIMLGIFAVSPSQADFLFKFLYAVYGALFIEYWGKTLGKYFGKLQVIDISGEKPVLLYLGLRELAKSLYLIPFVGWVAAVISLAMMAVRKDGRSLHDFIGNTKVVYEWQVRQEEDNERE